MRRAHSLFFAMAACLPLAGCYYDPDYGYVRNGYGADTYYGEETTVVAPVYAPGYRYYDYGPGCCYSNISVGTVWYDGYGRRRYDRDHDWHGHPPPRAGWHDGRRDVSSLPTTGDGPCGDRVGRGRAVGRPAALSVFPTSCGHVRPALIVRRTRSKAVRIRAGPAPSAIARQQHDRSAERRSKKERPCHCQTTAVI